MSEQKKTEAEVAEDELKKALETEVEFEFDDDLPPPPEADEPAHVSLEEALAGITSPEGEGESSAQSLDPLEAELIAITAERDELKDKLMRALAEAENTRRRAERDRKDGEAYGGTKLARDLLSVHDNLERALAAADDDMRSAAASLIEGVELTQKDLLNAFGKHKIEMVSPEKGEKFDPNLHQAMFEAPIPDAESGTVIEVMQAGFTISGRLLRPALVGVAKFA